ncbi:U-actitoxin-Avd3q-like [Ceratitis capitata]|uniref:U-actitoxin-Avd3q-like n=1 Tax=Ceratitis capitata TaxID=7213 RepID=UPI000A10D47A|nr:U-actitoxin-Avd3q-like [Ceratitis capitata]
MDNCDFKIKSALAINPWSVFEIIAIDKMILIFFLFVLIVSQYGVYAQQCGPLNNPTCTEPRNPGFNGDRCNGGTRWYYNTGSRQCESFFYWGCGGNSNRYCSLFACQQRCRIIFNP